MGIERVDVSVFDIPLEQPQADGTLTWDSTTVVVVEAVAAGTTGIGFTYGPAACSAVVEEVLAARVLGREALDVAGTWEAMVRSVRNMGRPGIASLAIAAVDTALWDLKARLLGVPLARLLGMVRRGVPVYWSGGFTSYPDDVLAAELRGWAWDDGVSRVKMKIGHERGGDVGRDVQRVKVAREALGDDVELFVDANGAYSRKQAVRMARSLSDLGVVWFEEPVSSDDLEGLRVVRDAIDIDVAAGEYGYDVSYFARMAPVVDVLQIDASRCAGITGWLQAAAVAAGHQLEVSAHTAQSLHAHPACALSHIRHVEYFADHHAADRIVFDGTLDVSEGMLSPDLSVAGNGLRVKHSDAAPYLVHSRALEAEGARR